ncbi:type II secretion system protein GspM [Congregibacter litoralis]|uniref:Type II secretion system (T2SS), protein M subtype b n=1 Tax=Congregibacter litoralis KT71 TaxID=314285 RepID=A4A5M0_9GAMM|nr:type II secretion system protein GspM [Congregibacter litoralis]EAQ98317.1 Type II secretion system (T2SS), protein M subtype b [Congregibacter litoralis KT71]
MNWIRLHRRTSLFVGITLILPVFFYLKTVFGLLGLGFEYAGDRGRIEPRVARLKGLLQNEAELVKQSQVAEKRLREMAFPATDDPSALAARLQADIRQILSEAGMSVSNSQVMPVRQGELFDQVAVKLTTAGSLSALDAALAGIAAYRPQLLIESLDTFPVRANARNADEEQSVTAVMQLMVLRVLP